MSTVQLIVGSLTFSVSAELISEKSDYFKALLQSGMLEATTRQVTLPDLDKTTMEIIINYVEKDTLGNFDISIIEQVMEVSF